MRGMRGGFKNIATNVTGQETKKKSSWLTTLIMVLLVAAAGALLYNRFG